MPITDAAGALEFVRANHRAIIAVRRTDGTPAMSPIVAGVLDDKLVISSRETAYKVRSLRADPHAWLCVIPDGFFGQWIHVAVDVEIVSMPEALEPLKAYYRSIAGEHPDWAEYEATMAREKRVLLRCTPTEVGPSKQG